jgi:hypothetical protein
VPLLDGQTWAIKQITLKIANLETGEERTVTFATLPAASRRHTCEQDLRTVLAEAGRPLTGLEIVDAVKHAMLTGRIRHGYARSTVFAALSRMRQRGELDHGGRGVYALSGQTPQGGGMPSGCC